MVRGVVRRENNFAKIRLSLAVRNLGREIHFRIFRHLYERLTVLLKLTTLSFHALAEGGAAIFGQ